MPFSAIGADHALEQENRAIKDLGGIKGIANSQKLLNEYFLTAAEMSNIVEQFSTPRKREEHYQLIGSKNSCLSTNVNKLLDVFNAQGIIFEENLQCFDKESTCN